MATFESATSVSPRTICSSGRVYRWAVSAVALIGAGAFALSFLALRDLMLAVGYRVGTAWIFPAIIDTAVAVSTTILVALGDKPVRRTRTVSAPTSAQVKAGAHTAPASASAPPRPHSVRAGQVASSAESAPTRSALRASSAQVAAVRAEKDYSALAQALVDAGATTKPSAMVASILSAHAVGTRPNRIAADLSIHHKAVSKIIDAAERRHSGTTDHRRVPDVTPPDHLPDCQMCNRLGRSGCGATAPPPLDRRGTAHGYGLQGRLIER